MARKRRRRSSAATKQRPRGRPKTATPFPAGLLRATVPVRDVRIRGDAVSAAADAPEVLCLPSPDWLRHELKVSGPIPDLTAFQVAATGPGVIPWRQKVTELAEGWFNRMIAMPVQQRTISVTGAHILADRLRDALEARSAFDGEDARRAGACPLDLHALVPVPAAMLDRGPGDPAAIAWLWAHWGTTWPLREVRAQRNPRRRSPNGLVRFRFHAADWSPWPALRAIRARWPGLRFDLQPIYAAWPAPSGADSQRAPG